MINNQDRAEKLRGELIYLNEHWHISVSGIAKEANLHFQHLNNFKLGKDTFGDIRLNKLEKVLNEKYKNLLQEELHETIFK
ncbi:hypothetical protein [Enterococcus durans]|uniref:hypothetical protein n=1 Tax=Enterococcus durans TaxID=53345 RepID=UPI001C8CE2A3|nr:hypothetical protein [Enterococcus durans]MBX9041642.1 hypothetical protein [Enterococcus durans]MBX9078561.1 hypothetical protein [Enterococcus durans]